MSPNTLVDKNFIRFNNVSTENDGQYECKYIKDLSVYSFVVTLATKGEL